MVKLNLRGNNIKQAQSKPLITKYVKKQKLSFEDEIEMQIRDTAQ